MAPYRFGSSRLVLCGPHVALAVHDVARTLLILPGTFGDVSRLRPGGSNRAPRRIRSPLPNCPARNRAPIPKQAAIWLLERLYDLLMILVLFGLGLAYARRLDIPANSDLVPLLRVGGWIVSAGAAVVAAILYALSRHRIFCERRLGALTDILPTRLQERFRHSLKSFLAGTSAAR